MLMFMLLFVVCAVGGFYAASAKRLSVPLDKNKKVSIGWDKIYLVAFSVILLLLCGLRSSEIGVDTGTYVSTFMIPEALESSVDGNTKYEIGYVLFVKLLRLFTKHHQVYIFATALVMIVGLYYFVRENCSGQYGIALMVYVAFLYYVDFSAIRQAMALSIAINSLQFLKKKKWVPALLIILLGASFQKTALLLLVMVPFIITTREKLKVVIAVALSVVGVLIFEPLVELLLKIFPIYERYWNSEMMEGTGGVGVFAIMVSVLCVIAAGTLFADRVRFRNPIHRNRFVLALIGSIFTVTINLLGRQYGIFSRMTRYFIPYVMVLAVEIYRCCVPKLELDIHWVCNLLRRLKLDGVIKLEQFRDEARYPALSVYRVHLKDLYYWLITAMMGIYFYTIMRGNLYLIIPYRFFFT